MVHQDLGRCSVRQVSESTWVVKGDTKLGDKYPSYVVRFRDGRYFCTYFETSWGGSGGGGVRFVHTLRQ